MRDIKNTILSIAYFTIMLFLFSCENDNKNAKRSQSNVYDEQWNDGRKIYLEKCSACHIGIKKDEVLANFIDDLWKKNEKDKLTLLSNIFQDSDHKNKNINKEELNKDDLKALLKFIETPQKSGIVN